MRELGLTSIYHDMGSASPRRESTKRFILRCETCKMEVLRRKRPPALVSCGRCSRRTYDPRFQIRVLEIVETHGRAGTLLSGCLLDGGDQGAA